MDFWTDPTLRDWGTTFFLPLIIVTHHISPLEPRMLVQVTDGLCQWSERCFQQWWPSSSRTSSIVECHGGLATGVLTTTFHVDGMSNLWGRLTDGRFRLLMKMSQMMRCPTGAVAWHTYMTAVSSCHGTLTGPAEKKKQVEGNSTESPCVKSEAWRLVAFLFWHVLANFNFGLWSPVFAQWQGTSGR